MAAAGSEQLQRRQQLRVSWEAWSASKEEWRQRQLEHFTQVRLHMCDTNIPVNVSFVLLLQILCSNRKVCFAHQDSYMLPFETILVLEY